MITIDCESPLKVGNVANICARHLHRQKPCVFAISTNPRKLFLLVSLFPADRDTIKFHAVMSRNYHICEILINLSLSLCFIAILFVIPFNAPPPSSILSGSLETGSGTHSLGLLHLPALTVLRWAVVCLAAGCQQTRQGLSVCSMEGVALR